MNGKQRIGHLMVATGQTISDLARQHGYTKQAWYDVIKGRTRTPKLRQKIADLTGLPVEEIWPEEPSAEDSQKSSSNC